jgi:hypothetical protein
MVIFKSGHFKAFKSSVVYLPFKNLNKNIYLVNFYLKLFYYWVVNLKYLVFEAYND